MRKQSKVIRRRRSSEEWTALLAEQVESGLSQRAFSELHAVSLSSFYNAKSRAKALTGEGEFIAVELDRVPSESAQGNWDIELTLGTGVALRLRRV